jgi:ABC-type spermidine/putrescine transport system permease subunit II
MIRLRLQAWRFPGLMLQLGPIGLHQFAFFFVPTCIFFLYSFWTVQEWNLVQDWNLGNYRQVFVSPVYIGLIIRSLVLGVVTATISVAVVFPLAYTLVFKLARWRDFVLFLLILSLFGNYVVRIYAWRSILSANGLISYFLVALGFASEQQSYFIHSPSGVIVVLLNVYIPFGVLPIFAALQNIRRDVLDAAADLGGGPLQIFWRVTLPLAMPGVMATFGFIFLLSSGDFVTPELVGGISGMMIGNAVATQFGMVSNWPLGAAMVFSTVLVFAVVFAALFVSWRGLCLMRKRLRAWPMRSSGTRHREACSGYIRWHFPILPVLEIYSGLVICFLFLPVVMLVVMSFNASMIGTFPLQGFTFAWYQRAFANQVIWPALQNSLMIATATAFLSALLGTPAAFALTRRNFRFRGLLRNFILLPISLPSLLIGISLLSFFALLSVQRSLITVTIGHVVYCVPFMVLAISARLAEFDNTIEDAARDLGANSLQTFRLVTFPLIRPTIIGGMLLIFALSFDMLVITYFNIGAQSTLPMVIWSMMRVGIDPSLNALSTMVMAFSAVILIVVHRLCGVKLIE